MPRPILITIDGQAIPGELNDGETARALERRLPLKVRMSRWGDEYYGDIGAALGVKGSRDAREEMAVGELAYWPPGNALCLFFGPTPASDGAEPRAASPVNPVGKVTGDLGFLAKLGSSVKVEVTAAAR